MNNRLITKQKENTLNINKQLVNFLSTIKRLQPKKMTSNSPTDQSARSIRLLHFISNHQPPSNRHRDNQSNPLSSKRISVTQYVEKLTNSGRDNSNTDDNDNISRDPQYAATHITGGSSSQSL